MAVALVGLQFAAVADAALPLQRKRCGQVVRSSFRLANDLSCTGDGLKVGASGITIDLNGHTLRGDGGEDDDGIDNTEGHSGVVIRGREGVVSRIIGFHDGIKVGSLAARNTVRYITLIQSVADGIDLDGGHHHVVSDSRIIGSGENGIESSSDDLTVVRSVIRDSGENGVEHAGARVTMRHLTVRKSRENGVALTSTVGTLSALELTGSKLNGLLVNGSQLQIAGVVARANLLRGITLLGGDNTVTGADVRINGVLDANSGGIALFSSGNILDQSTVRENQGHGVYVFGDQSSILNTTVCGNAFSEIEDLGSGTVLQDNTVADICPTS